MAPGLPRRPLNPPASVLDAFGVGPATRLPDGRSGAYRAGDIVLKQTDEREGAWLAGVLDDLDEPPDLRIIRPVAARDGRWVVDGWAAWAWLEGQHVWRSTAERVDVSRRFHAAVAHVERPPHLADHAWTRGHAWAWGELDLAVPAQFDDVVSTLRARQRPLDLPCQLVHGDLAGNVLHHPTLPPAVIDVSPCWRPARYGDAIVVADAVGWWDAPLDDLDLLADEEGLQLLIRAVLFRLGSAAELCADEPARLSAELSTYERVVAPLLRRAR